MRNISSAALASASPRRRRRRFVVADDFTFIHGRVGTNETADIDMDLSRHPPAACLVAVSVPQPPRYYPWRSEREGRAPLLCPEQLACDPVVAAPYLGLFTWLATWLVKYQSDAFHGRLK